MKLNITYHLLVRDKDGKTVQELQTPGHSFVQQFIELLYTVMLNKTFTITDTTNTGRSVTGPDIDILDTRSLVNNSTFGILVGTGTTAVLVTDHVLETPIVEGTSSGQLTHGAEIATAPTVTGVTSQFSHARPFTNGSGATITVTEVGLYAVGSAGSNVFLIAREILSSSIAILNGQTLDVTSQLQISA